MKQIDNTYLPALTGADAKPDVPVVDDFAPAIKLGCLAVLAVIALTALRFMGWL